MNTPSLTSLPGALQNGPKQKPAVLGQCRSDSTGWRSSKCGNNLAYRLDNFVETEWQCQESCCFLDGSESFFSDRSPVVFSCRELLWCLEKGDFDKHINYASFCEQFQEHNKDQRREQILFHGMFSMVRQKHFPLSLPSP